MDDQVIETISEVLEAMFCFPVNQPQPVWVATESDAGAVVFAPLSPADGELIMRLKRLVEDAKPFITIINSGS